MRFKTKIEGQERICIATNYYHEENFKNLTESLISVLSASLSKDYINEDAGVVADLIKEMLQNSEEIQKYELLKI